MMSWLPLCTCSIEIVAWKVGHLGHKVCYWCPVESPFLMKFQWVTECLEKIHLLKKIIISPTLHYTDQENTVQYGTHKHAVTPLAIYLFWILADHPRYTDDLVRVGIIKLTLIQLLCAWIVKWVSEFKKKTLCMLVLDQVTLHNWPLCLEGPIFVMT